MLGRRQNVGLKIGAFAASNWVTPQALSAFKKKTATEYAEIFVYICEETPFLELFGVVCIVWNRITEYFSGRKFSAGKVQEENVPFESRPKYDYGSRTWVVVLKDCFPNLAHPFRPS